ncbi:MAG: putative permease [Phormidesmis priestleyi Ana]|uniref:Putative permease n=1 Tax=Phormidesmis priestleyi Ana TaxID=1666911 RepID=A0A0P7ZV57_9CYAN|nr:MAG: putative permease [Phormidesmis priestleyi Ana]
MSLRQWLWLGVLSFFWGSAFIFMEVALPTFSPLLIVTGRMGLAALVLNGALLWQEKLRLELSTLSRSLWLKCAGLSLLSNLLPFGLIVWGQQHISASLASILIAATPLFTVVLAVFLVGERLTVVRGFGVALGFAGVIVLIGPEVLRGFDLGGLGELAILGAALFYAIGGFVGSRFNTVPSQLLSTMTVTSGAVIMATFVIVLGLVDPTSPSLLVTNWRWSAGLALLCLGVFPTAIAYLIYYRLLAQAGVVNTSLVSFLVPLSTLVLGAVFLSDRLDLAAIIGMSCILSGLAILDGRALKLLKIKIN